MVVLAYAGLACIEAVLISVLAMYAGLASILEITVPIETGLSMPVGEALCGSAFANVPSSPFLLALFFMKTMAVSAIIVKEAIVIQNTAAATPPITATGIVDVTTVLSTVEEATERIENSN